MSEQIVPFTHEYYADLRDMGGDPTAGMDGSELDPEFRDTPDTSRTAGAVDQKQLAELEELELAASRYAMQNLGWVGCECVIPRAQVDRLRKSFLGEITYLAAASMTTMTTEVEGVE